jgi:beta-lactamase regulating signal transducer with metallopeptidase domain
MLRAVHFLSQPLVESLGWSLVHFLWQGLVLANVLLFLLFFLRRRSANARYLAACGVLLAMAACPVATFAWIWCHAEARPPIAGTDAEVQVVPFDAPLADGSATERTAAAGPALSAWEGPAGEEREASLAEAPPPAATSSFMPGLLHAVERTIPWLVLAWLAGVAACSLRLGLGWLRLRQLKSAGSDAAVHWQDVAAGLAQRLGVSRPVRFLESLLVEVPTVVGWLRPVVLLPARALTGLTPVQLESLLAHELAHIRRDDYLVNLLQTLIETLLFYHPGVWWVSGRVRQEREHCCDDLAVRVCRDRVGYVRALAALEELRATAPRLVVAAGDGSLLQRVRRLLGSAEARPGGLHVSLVTLLAVLLIATMFVAPFVIPAGTLADRPQHDQPTGTADEESGETTLLIANWGAVLDEPVVEQLCKLSAGEVKSQDGVRTWLANADKARQAVCAARDRKQFVTTSSRVEWLARDSVNPVGFCTVSGFHQASFTSCNVLCQRTTEMSVAGSEASLNLRLEFNGQAGGAGQQFELKKQLPASAKVAAGQAFLVAVDLGSLHDWRLRCVVAFEAVPVAASRRADYQLITSCDWWLPLTQTSVARLFRQAETWRQRAALRPQKMLTAWTRTLPHGAKVNLVAVGRPRLDPFRWWDAEGQPHAFDWRKLGGVPEQHELVAILRIWEAPGTVAGYDGNRNQRAGGHSRFGIGFYPDDWPETPGSQLVIVPVEELTAQGGPQLTVGFGAGPWPAAHRLPLREEVSRDGQGFFLDDRAPHPSAGLPPTKSRSSAPRCRAYRRRRATSPGSMATACAPRSLRAGCFSCRWSNWTRFAGTSRRLWPSISRPR